MTSSIHELSGNIVSHEKQEQTDSQFQSPTPPGRNYESMATSLVYSEPVPPPHQGSTLPMAPGQYPYPDPYYRSIFAPPPQQPYAGVHVQLMGMQQQGVPLPSDAVEEPVFVNAKQYHGILRRRQSRAKLESQNKVIKSRKPYLHESRHLHAIRRPRGCGGRFLNAKKEDEHHEESHEDSSNLSSGKSAMAASSGTS
ncbi:PREDICTED: nuclear transcription factor Y subunit A-7 isoform X1 [Camelina sativa]|uniref:Nuclear transcription factor Y subunit n=1 Tax=Camelina sativa TaxID=90675 RepID=A0ABM0VTF0_CAMSA|nr:PREDICTED: nuclear transcription factor Y subunit A-7 isoform X1 [Camelina sativa]